MADNEQPTRIYPCPQCRKPSRWDDNPWRPFCSERCKLIDLGDWASER
ncbi:DNA gyrase inhibitor YacG, partial [Alloalcanivorax sp.]|nr:DNA gyrase inhibitor YacG [Alcanivorax sp.]